MPKRTLSYKCLLITPSDVTVFRDEVEDAIQFWNAHTGRTRDIRIESAHWKSHAWPGPAGSAQSVINTQIVDDSDFGLAIFWARIGQKTDKHESGSVEEICRLRERGCQVAVYFCKGDIPQTQLGDDQFFRLMKLKKELQAHGGIVVEFTSSEELKYLIGQHITSIVDSLEDHEKDTSMDRLNSLNTLINGVRIAPYQVGKIHAKVWLGLLGGGDDKYSSQNLRFEYEHVYVPLPEPIEAERDQVISRLAREAKEGNREFFNSPTIRLHSISLGLHQTLNGHEAKAPLFKFRPTCWYDYALSNQRLAELIFIPGQGTMTIRDAYADENTLLLYRNTEWLRLSNILTISVVLRSEDEYTLVSRRSRRVDNHAGVYAASAAENMHRWKDEPSKASDFWSSPNSVVWEDEPSKTSDPWCPNSVVSIADKVTPDYEPIVCPNPFFTAIRGIREEVAKEVAATVSPKDVYFLALAWDLGHFNPHLYAVVRVPLKIKEIEKLIAAARAVDSWEGDLIALPFSPDGTLKELLMQAPWAEVAKGAVLRALVDKEGFQAVNKALT